MGISTSRSLTSTIPHPKNSSLGEEARMLTRPAMMPAEKCPFALEVTAVVSVDSPSIPAIVTVVLL